MQKHVFVAIFLRGPMAAIQPVWNNGCNISLAIRKLEGSYKTTPGGPHRDLVGCCKLAQTTPEGPYKFNNIDGSSG